MNTLVRRGFFREAIGQRSLKDWVASSYGKTFHSLKVHYMYYLQLQATWSMAATSFTVTSHRIEGRWIDNLIDFFELTEFFLLIFNYPLDNIKWIISTYNPFPLRRATELRPSLCSDHYKVSTSLDLNHDSNHFSSIHNCLRIRKLNCENRMVSRVLCDG